jgi:hypothetical protein
MEEAICADRENYLVLCARLLAALKKADPANALVAQAEKFMAKDLAARVLREPAGMEGAPARHAYTVEPHGDGYALYDGRDSMHHGLNLAHITETTPQVCAVIERALNAYAAEDHL